MKRKHISQFVLLLALLLLFNILSSRLHVRFDLTGEKRFSLSEPTKKMLKNLDDVVTVEVYLKGSFPAGFQKLQESTREVLQEFKEYGGKNIRFQFINPTEGQDDKNVMETYKKLSEKGITPVRLQVQQDADDGFSEKIIFPSARFSYHQKDYVVNLLESKLSMSPDEKLNYAETLLEYKFINAIKMLHQPDRKKVAVLVGNDNQLGYQTMDILVSLEKMYDLDTLDLNQNFEIPKAYSAALVIAPTKAFDEKEKFKLDQYIMHGGHVLWAIDPMRYAMDSLRNQDATLALAYDLNLDDMLFRYGVRINADYIEDYQQANPIPVTVGQIGDQPDIRLLPWSYYPYCIPNSKHPIVNNMDAVMCMMASSIDTVGNPEIKKTILLASSNHSRRVPAPVRVSLSNLKFKPTPEMFREKNIPVAVILEGKFQSIFTNRLDPNFLRIYRDSIKREFLTESQESGSMVVLSDANILSNDFTDKRGPLECGYYKYTDQYFSNKTFIFNCLEYMTDTYGLLEARNKTVKLRLLDMARVKKEKMKWQVINTAIPAALVFILASAWFFFRRKKYEGKVN
jgi:gliding-associated putative ABC transporter substrate-binding component GldG